MREKNADSTTLSVLPLASNPSVMFLSTLLASLKVVLSWIPQEPQEGI